jgi:hypothetical protein
VFDDDDDLMFDLQHGDWLNELYDIPERLQPALGVYGRVRKFEVVEALARELHVRHHDIIDCLGACFLLFSLTGYLDLALREGSHYLDIRGNDYGPRAVAQLNLIEVLEAMRYFKWARGQYRGSYARFERGAREELGRKLSSQINEALMRWQKLGHFKRVALAG